MTTLLKRLDDWFFNFLLFEKSDKKEEELIAFCDKKFRMEMLEKQELKLLPPDSGTKIGRDGVWLQLAYSYREYTHTRYKKTFRKNGVEYNTFDPYDEGIKVFTQDWTYYAWDKFIKRWSRVGGHSQTCDEESKDMFTKKEVA